MKLICLADMSGSSLRCSRAKIIAEMFRIWEIEIEEKKM